LFKGQKLRTDSPTESIHRKQPSSAPSAETETLNFKVTSGFKREFKSYAVNRGITMLELLKEGFELTKSNRSAK